MTRNEYEQNLIEIILLLYDEMKLENTLKLSNTLFFKYR